ncbi:hypothetical protein PIB30_046670 [Stylosanthes scabra]|uniref:Uncharacterized protein n=1 Tax=Stylosanthes scabra TaxID=79078 RepID=A0ABU6SGD7_9FABA|nr:hypothetical protein [Stylosanthes scabra]
METWRGRELRSSNREEKARPKNGDAGSRSRSLERRWRLERGDTNGDGGSARWSTSEERRREWHEQRRGDERSATARRGTTVGSAQSGVQIEDWEAMKMESKRRKRVLRFREMSKSVLQK